MIDTLALAILGAALYLAGRYKGRRESFADGLACGVAAVQDAAADQVRAVLARAAEPPHGPLYRRDQVEHARRGLQ